MRLRPVRATTWSSWATDPDHVPRQVLRLSDPGLECLFEPGAGRDGALPDQLRAGPDASGGGPAVVRGLGVEPVWPAPVRDFFQDLYREGLGDPDQRTLRGLGGAADPRPQPGRGDSQCRP